MRWTIRKGIGKREIIDSQGKICGYLICKNRPFVKFWIAQVIA